MNDELGDARAAAWLAYQALKTCVVKDQGQRFQEYRFSPAEVKRAMEALERIGVNNVAQ